MWCYISKIYVNHFLWGYSRSQHSTPVQTWPWPRTKIRAEGANRKGDHIQYAPGPVWVATCWRLRSRTSKMFTRITNLDGILHTPMCCECEQEISPTEYSRLGARISILGIRICTGGPICATDSRCTLVHEQRVESHKTSRWPEDGSSPLENERVKQEEEYMGCSLIVSSAARLAL